MEMEIGQILTQILAFLFVFWVMKKIAWKPFLGILDERKKAIASQFSSIEERKKEVDSLASSYQEKLSQIETLSREKMKEVIHQGLQKAAAIEEEAKANASTFLQKAKGQLQSEVESAKKSLKGEVAALALQIAEKTIGETVNSDAANKVAAKYLEKTGL